MSDPGKQAAALAALEAVEDGMALGLGTGSTAALFVDALGARVKAGLRVTGVPTSAATAAQAEALGIPLTSLEEAGRLDLTVDGADEIGPGLALIKGGGGALLREKIVAASSARMLVIADSSKQVAALGAFALPVEIVRFGWRSTADRVDAALAGLGFSAPSVVLRMRHGAPFLTDEGHLILDCALGTIPDPAALDIALNAVTGVVETGIFAGIAGAAILGAPDGSVTRLGAA
ncbi:ribose-5-phosphate isomerase RpiA [Paralimibaculum aggregatum]|uniref:Ribose-5-phosphate isomerase A n=1 Tax=Paralimibaculum aggregatum TaxID=3036245 RepID=A0ABQ6LS97_9RHOB|nr:ribose-5-phosphate isomerase RpiA [Limibaculum sp. NKW23]GMG84715.1 ribose-5-phosphate isomerase RpiA [Limibaculum sp. NKW23]